MAGASPEVHVGRRLQPSSGEAGRRLALIHLKPIVFECVRGGRSYPVFAFWSVLIGEDGWNGWNRWVEVAGRALKLCRIQRGREGAVRDRSHNYRGRCT